MARVRVRAEATLACIPGILRENRPAGIHEDDCRHIREQREAMRIAIVDDDPIVCQSLETILTATGTADVLWSANDGGAAIRRYFESPENHLDILLIDIQMPGMNGLDAAREILLISRSPISAMSLVAMPRALMVVGVLNSYTWANSSAVK